MPRHHNPETQCQQVFPSGRRCRLPRAQGHPALCAHHAQQARQAQDAEALAAQLLAQIEDFTSAAPVNQFLANLLRMTARGLIPRRDAAVLAYIAQSLLNGLAARRRELLEEQKLAENEPVQIVWDIPRCGPDDSPVCSAMPDAAQLPQAELTDRPDGEESSVPLPTHRRREYNGTGFRGAPHLTSESAESR